MSVKPIPEDYTSLTPFLCIDGASAAIDFYVSVFGAKLVDRRDRRQSPSRPAPPSVNPPRPLSPATGSRPSSIRQRWTVMTRVEDVSPEERDRRMAEWATQNA